MPRRHRFEFRVPFADVDHAGIVYYPRLFHYFHLAYEDFFHTALGFPFQEWFQGASALAAPIIQAEARFLAPLRHGDRVRVEAWIERLEPRGWRWRFELWKGEELCATGRVRHALVDPATMARGELPAAWRSRLEPWVESPPEE